MRLNIRNFKNFVNWNFEILWVSHCSVQSDLTWVKTHLTSTVQRVTEVKFFTPRYVEYSPIRYLLFLSRWQKGRIFQSCIVWCFHSCLWMLFYNHLHFRLLQLLRRGWSPLHYVWRGSYRLPRHLCVHACETLWTWYCSQWNTGLERRG